MNRLVLLLSFVLSGLGCMAQGHRIDFTIKGMRDSVVILGYYNGEKLSVQDSLKLDKNGKGTVAGPENLPRGKYFLYLDDKKRFDLLVGNEQQFGIVADTADLVNGIEATNSLENKLFYDYIRYIQQKIERRTQLEEAARTATDPAKKAEIQAQQQTLMTEVRTHMDALINANPTTLFAKQLKASFQVEMPAELQKADRNKQLAYYKAHYFDHIDFGESGLARTREFPEMVDTYLDKLTYPVPDSIYPAVDELLKRSRKHPEMFKFMLMHLHDFYVTHENLEMENVYVWLAEKYFFPEATWIAKDFIERRKEAVAKLKPLLIGQPAPELTLEAYDDQMHTLFSQLIRLSQDGDQAKKKIEAKTDVEHWTKRQTEITDSLNKLNDKVMTHPKRRSVALKDIKARYTILAFWEPDCSHCKKAIPELYSKYTQSLKAQGVEVLAVCTQLKPNVWGEFLTKHNLMTWQNAWDPYNLSKFRDKYDIHSTPTVFVLDAQKRILLKKVSVEHIEEALKYLDGRYK